MIVVEVDADLQDLMPGYLKNKRKEIDTLRAALPGNEFEKISMIGHGMKGNGSAYGLMRISEIGQLLEDAAKRGSVTEINRMVADLEQYLQQIEIVYIEEQ